MDVLTVGGVTRGACGGFGIAGADEERVEDGLRVVCCELEFLLVDISWVTWEYCMIYVGKETPGKEGEECVRHFVIEVLRSNAESVSGL